MSHFPNQTALPYPITLFTQDGVATPTITCMRKCTIPLPRPSFMLVVFPILMYFEFCAISCSSNLLIRPERQILNKGSEWNHFLNNQT
jgi:hypothetical protein